MDIKKSEGIITFCMMGCKHLIDKGVVADEKLIQRYVDMDKRIGAAYCHTKLDSDEFDKIAVDAGELAYDMTREL